MVSHLRAGFVVVLGGASWVLAACSGGGDGAPTDDEKPITINSILGMPDYAHVDPGAREQAIEELIASCMANEGWEYLPVNYPDINAPAEYADEDELERIEREGLGVAYAALRQDEAPLESLDAWADFVDPNVAYVESLSETERAAYDDSLYGPEAERLAATVTVTDAITGEQIGLVTEPLGCSGQAFEEVDGSDPFQDPNLQEALIRYYDELAQRADADPRLIEMNRDWSACMKEAGFAFDDIGSFNDKAYEEFRERVGEVVGQDSGATPPVDLPEDAAGPREVERTALTPEQREGLEAVLADEIRVAKAQYTCSKDMTEEMARVWAEIEERFALEHESELKELLASVATEK